jgi:ribosomal protein L7/L12
MSNQALETQVNQLEGQWQKRSSGDYKLADCLNNFHEGLQSDERLLGWISASPLPFRMANLLLLLTDKRLIVCEDRLISSDNISIPLESITSIVTGNKGIFGSNRTLQVKEVARAISFHSFTKEFCDKFFTALSNAHTAAKAKPTIPPPTSSTGSDPITQLERLADLKAKGILTEEEFLAQKRKVLGVPPNTPSSPPSEESPQTKGAEVKAPPIIGDKPGPKPPPLFDLMLVRVAADKKIAIVIALRQVKPSLGLAEAKELVETLPSKVLEGVSEPVSRAAKEKLEQAGAGVRLDMLPFG